MSETVTTLYTEKSLITARAGVYRLSNIWEASGENSHNSKDAALGKPMYNSWRSLDGGCISRIDLLVCTAQKSDELPHTVKLKPSPCSTYRIVGISGDKMEFILNVPIDESTIYECCTRVFHQFRVRNKSSQNVYYGLNFLSSIEADSFYEEMCKAITETSKYPHQQTAVTSFKDSFSSTMPLVNAAKAAAAIASKRQGLEETAEQSPQNTLKAEQDATAGKLIDISKEVIKLRKEMYSFYQIVQSEIVSIKAMLDTLNELYAQRMKNKAVETVTRAKWTKGEMHGKERGNDKERRDNAPSLSSGRHLLLKHSKTMNADAFTASFSRSRANSASEKKNKESRKKDKKEHRQLFEKKFASVGFEAQ